MVIGVEEQELYLKKLTLKLMVFLLLIIITQIVGEMILLEEQGLMRAIHLVILQLEITGIC